MHRYEATVTWDGQGAAFVDNQYSRGHVWSFDGGAQIAASASPLIVPAPLSVPENVDPEEALVAATSSCHMLFFLHFAAKGGWVVEHYEDQAFGLMGKNDEGKTAITLITLRPQIQFQEGTVITEDQLKQLHHRAHEHCFIANSLQSEVIVED